MQFTAYTTARQLEKGITENHYRPPDHSLARKVQEGINFETSLEFSLIYLLAIDNQNQYVNVPVKNGHRLQHHTEQPTPHIFPPEVIAISSSFNPNNSAHSTSQ